MVDTLAVQLQLINLTKRQLLFKVKHRETRMTTLKKSKTQMYVKKSGGQTNIIECTHIEYCRTPYQSKNLLHYENKKAVKQNAYYGYTYGFRLG